MPVLLVQVCVEVQRGPKLRRLWGGGQSTRGGEGSPGVWVTGSGLSGEVLVPVWGRSQLLHLVVLDAVQLLEATVLLGRHQHDIDMEQKLKAKVISLKKEKQQVITGR